MKLIRVSKLRPKAETDHVTKGMVATESITNNGGAVRITTELLHFYKNNPNIDWLGKDGE